MPTNADTPSNAESLGHILREIRLSRKWSLKDFEIASKGLIKDVVLGSYERGSRSISVSKLQIISATYDIPISAFFAKDKSDRPAVNDKRVIIDLRKVQKEMQNSKSDVCVVLDQFTQSIINLRRDWNGEILSLRSSDIIFLSMITSTENEKFETFYLTRD
ncbi:transcriptional regulator [Actinomycetes bacterium]|nr:transcriptional regulator [Actinomycetes bacterium]